MAIIYGSVCSGIDSPTIAWEPLDWLAGWHDRDLELSA